MKTYQSKGTICVPGPFNLIYAVCDIEYRTSSNGDFCYIFRPHYSVIDLLTIDYFQGIPGLDLDLRREEYIRENRLPVFISERVPQENREGYYELFERLNMKYMEPIEYLIRSKEMLNEQYFGDTLFMRPFIEKQTINYDDYESHLTNNSFIKEILGNICLGHDVQIGNQTINDMNRKAFHDVFLTIYARSYHLQSKKQKDGIEAAKKEGKYRGRKPSPINFSEFQEAVNNVEMGLITAKEAAKRLGISIDKYYRLKNKLFKQF